MTRLRCARVALTGLRYLPSYIRNYGYRDGVVAWWEEMCYAEDLDSW